MANVKNFDYKRMFRDVGKVCLSEEVCGHCKEAGCYVGYARICIAQARHQKTDTIPGGFSEIPLVDLQNSYYTPDLHTAIARTLKQCRACKEEHTDDCLVNIVRSCYEAILFNDYRHFDGSAFQYLANLQADFSEDADAITYEYMRADDADDDEFDL